MKKIIALVLVFGALVIGLCGCSLQKQNTEATVEPTESGNKNYTVTIPAGDGSQSYKAYPDGTVELIADKDKKI